MIKKGRERKRESKGERKKERASDRKWAERERGGGGKNGLNKFYKSRKFVIYKYNGFKSDIGKNHVKIS